MNNFDNTKENIRIRELDKSDRKALFNKFKEAGGEVIKESKIKKPIRIDRNKQRDLISKLEKRSTQMSQRIPAKTSQQTKSSKNIIQNKAKTKKKKSRVLGSFLDKTLIKFKLYFFNVADFHTFALTEKFFNRFEVEYKTALVELQVIYLDIFKKIPHIGEEIIEQLDRMSPLYFELIEKSADLYNRITTDKIIDKYLTYPTDKHKISDYKEPILEYFRKLYILHNFQDTIFSAFDKAIAIHAKKLNKKVSIFSGRKKRIKIILQILFNKLFPRLYWLFCYYYNTVYDINDNIAIEQILSITDDMKSGNRISLEPSKLKADLTHTSTPEAKTSENEKKEQAELKPVNPPEQEKKIPLSLSTKRGLTIMSKIDISKLKNEFINKENLKKIADTDKVLLTFLFFNEFEKEYSFILTTNKIKFNTTYNEKGKIDFHKTLSALYDQTRPCKESFEEYFHSIETYEKARSERPISNAQYIQYAKNLSILEKEKIKKGRITRHIIKTFLENVAKNLDLLVKDMDTKNNFISNPQDVLDFDLKIEGEKKLNGKKIHQAISYVFDYISAYSYRLSTEGDLTGETEENSNQYEPLLEEKNINEEKNEPVLDLKAKSNINESKKENSVLEELNKIL